MLASCAGPAPAPATETPSPAPTAVLHAPEIRFALVGQPTTVNVWSLYDEAGASYANYAIHSEEFLTLYRLSIPEREFEPFTADGMPSIVAQEGEFYVASAKIQDGLTWSDGSVLTAEDVAFTVNTALAFDLSLDWRSAYNPEKLDRAEALADGSVKFYFKSPFNVGDWQYGALQGPIVNQAFWSPKVEAAVGLLPSQQLTASLEQVRAAAAEYQSRIDADNKQLLTTLTGSETYNELTARVERNQNELNSLNSKLVELQDEHAAALSAARAALFALPDDGEPTFGPFLRATEAGGVFTREVNPAYPFAPPNFDRAVYVPFKDYESAMDSVSEASGPIVLIRSTDGPSDEAGSEAYVSNRAGFLAFNPENEVLARGEIRLAFLCLLDDTRRMFPAGGRGWTELPLKGFSLVGPWQATRAADPCASVAGETALERAVYILEDSGYSWAQRPSDGTQGAGLTMPDGNPFPVLSLLDVTPGYDVARTTAGSAIAHYANYIGIPIENQWLDPASFRYAVYSSSEYDMAVLGYRLSAYPTYLCEWFQTPGPFAYGSERVADACERFNSTADLETARQASFELQAELLADLPFVPLYLASGHEARIGVAYPFEGVLNGISGIYGAPGLAMPAP